MNPDNTITITPGRLSGDPTISGTRVPVEHIAQSVWHHGEDGIADYENGWDFTRAQILTACWYAALYPVGWNQTTGSPRRNPFHARWRQWALKHHPAMWSGACDWDQIPCPPTKPPHDPVAPQD